MSAPRALAALAAVALLGVVSPAHAVDDDLTPTAQCIHYKVYKVYPYGGWAYTKSTQIPIRLTLWCTLDNNYERSITRQTLNSPVVVLAWAAQLTHADTPTLCTDALAEYANGVTRSVHHCRMFTETS